MIAARSVIRRCFGSQSVFDTDKYVLITQCGSNAAGKRLDRYLKLQ